MRQCIRAGARTAAEIGAACGAGTSCGGCRPAIDALIDALVLPRLCGRGVVAEPVEQSSVTYSG